MGNVANSTKNIIGGDVTLDAAGNVTGPFVVDGNNYTSIADAIDKTSIHYYSVNDGGATQANYNNDGATGFNSLAAGVGASSTGFNSLAAGVGASSTNQNAVSVGVRSVASGNESIVMGYESVASGERSQAYGFQAEATGYSAIAMGQGAVASAVDGIAIGGLSDASGYASVALGLEAVADGREATALGTSAVASGKYAIAMGPWSNAAEENTIAAGLYSEASAIGAIALGESSIANKEASVALGVKSTTATDATTEASATLNDLTYGTFAGQVTDPGMQVSVGSVGAERQIKNVGSGAISATSTDAINGSQLHATNEVLGNVANSVETILGGNATLNPAGNITMTNIGNTGKNTIHDAIAASQEKVVAGTNIASVDKVTDAVTGQSTYTVNANGTTASAGSSAVTVTAGTPDANNVTDYAVDLSQDTKDSLVKADTALQSIETQIDGVTVKNVNKDDNKVNFVTGDNVELTANADGSITVGTAADVTFNNVTTNNLTATGETKLGDNFTVTNAGDAYYTGPVTEGNHITNKTYVDQQTAAAKTEVEAGKNITVTPTTGNDGQTIYNVATADEVDFTKVTVGNTTITTDGLIITGGPSITTAGINAGGKKVTDVADGEISEDSTDAVNGSQLHTLGNNVTNLFGGNATYVDNQISWNNIGGTGQNTVDDAIRYVNDQAANANQGWKVTTDSGTAATSTVKPGDTVSITGDTASGVTVSNNGNDIKIGLADKVTIGSGSNAVSIDGNAGTIQVGDVHIDGSTGNITAGQVTVNGEAGTVNGLTNTTWNPADIVSGQAATEDQLKQVADNAAQAAAVAKSTVSEGENITVSPTKNADGSTNYQVATKKDVTFDKVTSGSVIADKVTVGKVVIDQAGINAGGIKVTNVADGAINSTSKDAINGSQLHASNTNIYNYLGGGANYETNTGPTYNVGGGSHNNVGDALTALDDRDNQLDNKITNLGDQLQQAFYTTNERIDDVEKRANAGIAAAMALETAPYVAGKWTYAAAASYHGGENAVGVTFRKTADNGRWSLTSGIAAASQGDPSFRIGISGVID